MASKYNNKRTAVDGFVFDSKREAARYGDLKLLEKMGKIKDLCADKAKLRYKLGVNHQLICVYVADFRYFDVQSKKEVIEDVKGMKTAVYKLKKKLLKAITNIEITEIA